jgi:4-hydroxy-2-oxoheptanedioate aldolase
MPLNGTPNQFKANIAAGLPQIGLWSSLAAPVVTEVVAGAGFDWFVVDTEHSPNELTDVLIHLQIAAAFPTEAVVRVPIFDPVVMKRYLDIGARTILIPMIEDEATAAAVVASTRYPPDGIRGVSISQRANRYGRVPGYQTHYADGLCLLLQIETRKGLATIADIAAVAGVDGLFIGPSDLSADLGHLGDPGHPAVQAAIRQAVDCCRAAGKPAGILAPVQADAQRYLDWGFTFVAVGSDLGVLTKGTDALVAAFNKPKG